MDHRRQIAIGLAGYIALAAGVALGQPAQKRNDRERFDKLFADGNFKDAYEGYRGLALDARTEPDRVGTDLKRGIECLARLGRLDEIDDFRDGVIAIHHGNWRLLQAAAESFLDDAQNGSPAATLDAGVEGGAQGGAPLVLTVPYVRVLERDRSRALQLLIQGLDRARLDPDRRAAGLYFHDARPSPHAPPGRVWSVGSSDPHASGHTARLEWAKRLLDPGHQLNRMGHRSFTVCPRALRRPGMTASGGAGHSHRPAWRMPACSTPRCAVLANFLRSEFGTQTIEWADIAREPFQGPSEAARPYALETLADDETVAQLATGIKRFKLPDEFNPIKIYQAIAGDPGTGHGEEALNILASIFVKRGQLDRVADYLKRSLEVYGEKDDRWKTKQLNQILGAWGEFAAARPQPAGRGASVDFRFRNSRRAHFEAHEILFDKLVKDVKDYFSPGPKLLDPRRGHRFIPAHDRGKRHCTGRPRAVPRLHVGRSRPLPRGGHDRGGDMHPDARPATGCRQGDAQADEDRLRCAAEAGRDTRRELGLETRLKRSGPPGDQGVDCRPVPSVGDHRRRTGPCDRRGLPAYDNRAGI